MRDDAWVSERWYAALDVRIAVHQAVRTSTYTVNSASHADRTAFSAFAASVTPNRLGAVDSACDQAIAFDLRRSARSQIVVPVPATTGACTWKPPDTIAIPPVD